MIYRADNQLLVNAHVDGRNAYDAPVLHVRQTRPGELFDAYTACFDAVWATARTPWGRRMAGTRQRILDARCDVGIG